MGLEDIAKETVFTQHQIESVFSPEDEALVKELQAEVRACAGDYEGLARSLKAKEPLLKIAAKLLELVLGRIGLS